MKHNYIRKTILLSLLGFGLAFAKQAQAQCVVNAGPDVEVCPNSNTTLTAIATGGSPGNYSWGSLPASLLPDNPTITVSPGTTTTYVVHATGNGCDAYDTVVVTVTPTQQAELQAGNGVDTSIFNGALTFYICAAAAQQAALFNFTNGLNPNTGYTTTIVWGDTAAPYTTSTPWTSVGHIYRRGIYNLRYTVTNNITGCSTTTNYKVFYGSNPAGGIASPGNTDICGPDWLTFLLYNYQNNTAGTIYRITFSDSTAPLIFNHPPPDSIAHYFERSSCGFTSTSGSTTFPNSFSASLVIENPCGVTAGAVVPIYVSIKPEADFSHPAVCANTPTTFTNTSTNGMAAGNSGCNSQTPILWSIQPATGWTITSGSLGNDNGYTGSIFNPSGWTSGSNTLTVSFTQAGNYQFQIIAGNKCTADTMGRMVCVTAAPSPAFSISTASSCAPFLDTLTNLTPPGVACSVPTFSWGISQGSSSCTQAAGNNYNFVNGTTADSTTAYLEFNNEGVYNVTLSANNVCGTFTSTKTITVKVKPEIAISVPPAGCFGQAVSPTANIKNCGGTMANYNWSFPGGTPSSSGSQAPGIVDYALQGNYNISLTADNECGSASASATIRIDTIPVANAGPDLEVCSGSNPQIGSTALPGLNYSWSPSTGLSSASAANPTVTLTNTGSSPITRTFILTVSSAANCSSKDTVSVTIYPAATVNAGPDAGVCTGQSATLSGSFGGAAASATWTAASGTFADANSPTTIYTPAISSGSITLTLTTDDPTGPCPAVSDVVNIFAVAPPVADAGNDVEVCGNASIKIGKPAQGGYDYHWTPATGLNDAAISEPTVTIANTGSSIITRTYTLLVSATGCSDTAQVTVSVYPAPVVNAGPGATTCGGGSVSLSGTVSGAATTATWSSASGSFSRTDTLHTIFTPNALSGTVMVFLTSNSPSAQCPAVTDTAIVTIKPIPAVTLNPAHQSICSGDTIQPIHLTSSEPGTTYSWTGTSPDGVTGFASTGTSSTIPARVLNNTSGANGTVIYTVTPTSAGCGGTPVTDTISVFPALLINTPASQSVCSGTATAATILSANISGATFSWTATGSANLSGFTASGTGNIPAQTINNNSAAADTVFYTVNGSAAGCTGTPVSFYVVVNPPLQVMVPQPQQICNGGTAAQVNFTANAPGTTFNWTATSTGNLSGYVDSGSGNIPAQVIRNNGPAAGTVTYSVTASGNGCNAVAQNYTITVDPALTISVSPASDSICTGTQTNFTLTGNTSGATFSWTVQAPPAISGAAAGNGNRIQQTLINNSSTVQQVQYIITPSDGVCGGEPDTISVIVKPGVIIEFTPTTQSVCSGQPSQHIVISSPNSNTGFVWTAQSSHITGFATSGTDSIPSQILVNNTLTADTVFYTVVPNNSGCLGQTATYITVVQPGPSAISPADQTLCSGASTQRISLSSVNPAVSYNWTGTTQSSITGFIPAGTDTVIPAHTLLNTGTTAGQVQYRVTPVANGCSGPPVSFVINVYPTPTVNPVSPQNLCTGSATTAVTLGGNIAGTTFNWTSVVTGAITGHTASGTGNIPAQTLVNAGNRTDTVIYTITPSANGCVGTPLSLRVTVNPKPTITMPGTTQTVCSGSASQSITLSSPNPGASITWTATVPNGITGAALSGTNVIPAQVLYNSTIDTFASLLTIQYSIQLQNSASGCATANGKYFITVKPKPMVGFNVTNMGGCSPVNVYVVPRTFNFVSPDSLTINWGDNSANTVIHPSTFKPMWSPVQHAYNNTGNQSVNFPITVTAKTTCLDTSITRPVTIDPNAVNALFSSSPANGCEPLTVSFKDQSSPGSSLSWCFDYNKATNNCNGGGMVTPAGATVQHTFAAGTHTVALYAAQGAGCANDTVYQTIYVSPAPGADFTPSAGLCEQTEISFTNSSVPAPGSFVNQYSWNFGDGNTSAAKDPKHTYPTAGTYTVCLAATASSGCKDTICHPVTISSKPIVDFRLPDACLNQQTGQFNNLSTGASFYRWSFGDNTTSADKDPIHPFTTAGTYAVKLVGSTNTCADSMSRNVTIYPLPAAAFTVPVPYTCGLPSAITMQNKSTDAIGYNWDFGNGTASTYPNPSATYTAEGDYIVSLVAMNQYSCTDTAKAPVSIYPFPNIESVHVDAEDGCQPVNVQFTVSATNAKHYFYDFGDGISYESSEPFASHIYTDTGSYTVLIRAYSYNDCGDTLSMPDTVNVHVRATANFEYYTDETEEIAKGMVQFINRSENSTAYVWTFSDGTISTQTHPQHIFPDIDQFDVRLVATTPFGCSDTAYKSVEVIKKSLFTPNAFAPDYKAGSDLVRVWKPAGTGLKEYHAQVFNKWGELLWESTALTEDMQPAEGWDGTYQGKECQQDVYVWKIQAVFLDGSRWGGMNYPNAPLKKTIGSVTLIR